MLQEVKTMLHVNINWQPPEVPEFDSEIHNPEKVFAFLCYRGVHYAKWVYLDVFKIGNWNLNNPRKGEKSE